jgi:MoaA/NifB/PqqE/SkfB family radical SAM enzyme
MKKISVSGNPNYDKFHFMWNLTNWCNYDCYYCYEKELRIDTWKKEQSITKYKLVLSRLKNFDAPFEVDLLGGEPTLHPNLPEILTKLVSFNNCIKTTLYTNLSRPLSYFEELDNKLNSEVTLTASFHPEYYDDKFIEKVIELKKLKNLKIFVTVIITDNKKYWPMTIKVLDSILENKVNYSLLLLMQTSLWKPRYDNGVVDFFEKYHTQINHSTHMVNYKYDDGTEETINALEAINKNMNRFKGYICDTRFFDIKFNGDIVNTCTREKINSLILKKEHMNNVLKCTLNHCTCEGMLDCFKRKL